MNIKKIIFLTLLILFFSNMIHSNEFFSPEKASAFSFTLKTNPFTYGVNPGSSFEKHIVDYSLTNTQKQKLFLIIGIAGTITLGTSLFFITPGIVMIAVSVASYSAPYEYRNYYSDDPGYNLWCSGIGFLAAGCVLFFLIGLPITIAGFVLYSYYGDKFTLFIDQKDDISRAGFALKF